MEDGFLTQEYFFLEELEIVIGKNKKEIQDMVEKGLFPKPDKYHDKFAWQKSIIDKWILHNYFANNLIR